MTSIVSYHAPAGTSTFVDCLRSERLRKLAFAPGNDLPVKLPTKTEIDNVSVFVDASNYSYNWNILCIRHLKITFLPIDVEKSLENPIHKI
jgi:hypothetical protein